MEREEYVINLRSVWIHILKRWKKICVVALVIALFANIGLAIKTINSNYKNSDSYYDSQIEIYEDTLTNKEIQAIEYAHSMNELYTKQYEDKMNYYENSLKMKINPDAVPELILQYSVTSSDSNINDIMPLFANNVISQELCQNVETALAGSVKKEYVSELITSKGNTSVDSNVIKVNANSDIFRVTIMALTEEQCRTIGDLVEQRVTILSASVNESYNNRVAVAKVSENYVQNADSSLETAQNKVQESIISLKKLITKDADALLGDSKSYYTIKYNRQKKERQSIISAKNIVVGILVGLVIPTVWFAFLYILARKIKEKEELKAKYGIQIFGESILLDQVKKSKNKLDAKICRMDNRAAYEISEMKQINRIVTEISMYAKQNQYDNIMITSTLRGKNVLVVKELQLT